MTEEVSIYVLPTEEGRPPRAIVGQSDGEKIAGVEATWSRDMGAWTISNVPVPAELGEAITDHAKSLGVEW